MTTAEMKREEKTLCTQIEAANAEARRHRQAADEARAEAAETRQRITETEGRIAELEAQLATA